jgi:hypothetical protein
VDILNEPKGGGPTALGLGGANNPDRKNHFFYEMFSRAPVNTAVISRVLVLRS